VEVRAEAVDELLPARARKKHIILLSDGQSPYDEIPDLVDAATAARITISSVGVGEGADQTLLKMVATRGGGRFYHTRDPASIPRIFSRETSELGDRSIVERPTPVHVAKRVSALAGVPLESAPALGGYVVTRPRPQAETILTAPDGTPVTWKSGHHAIAYSFPIATYVPTIVDGEWKPKSDSRRMIDLLEDGAS